MEFLKECEHLLPPPPPPPQKKKKNRWQNAWKITYHEEFNSDSTIMAGFGDVTKIHSLWFISVTLLCMLTLFIQMDF